MKRIPVLTTLTALLALWTVALWAAVPSTINYQGRLQDGSGNNVPNGVYTLAFKIYDIPSGGTALWSETLPVQVTGGLFTVELGNSPAFPSNLFSSGADRYLGVTVNLDPEISPRTHLNSVAYAYQAKDADVATLAQDLTCSGCVSSGDIADGSVGAADIDPSQVQTRVTGTAPGGQYITGINQNGTVVTAPDANNAYTAGTGLVLNGTQFSIPPSGVTSTEIADDAVGSTEIAVGAVASAEILDATVQFGDLGQNGAAGNQVIKWNGAAWVAGTDDVGAGGGGGDITGVSPGTGLTGGGLSGDVTLGIAVDGVTTTEILDGTVTSRDILDEDITSFDLGTGSVGADEIAAGAVVGGLGGDVADGSLTFDDLGSNSVSSDEIAAGAVVGGLAGDVADGSLTADDLGTNSVGSDEIATGAVGSGEIAVDAVGASQIALGAVGASEVADNSLFGTDIADGTIFAADLGTSSVGSDEIATGAVAGGLAGDVADGTLTHDDLGVGSVNADEIGFGAVTTSGVLDGSLLAADISDEPGVASNTGIGLLTLDGTVQTLLSQTLTAPAAGYVLVIATTRVAVTHTSGGSNSYAGFGVSSTAGVFPPNQNGTSVLIAAAAPSGIYEQIVTVHGLFSTPGGSDGFFLLGDEGNGNFEVEDRQLTLIYFPTFYGTVVPTVASAIENLPDQKGQSVSALLPEATTELAAAQPPDPVALQRELAEMKARMQKLEDQLQQNQKAVEDRQ